MIRCDAVFAMRLLIWAAVLYWDRIAMWRRAIVRARQDHLLVRTGIGPYPTVSLQIKH